MRRLAGLAGLALLLLSTMPGCIQRTTYLQQAPEPTEPPGFPTVRPTSDLYCWSRRSFLDTCLRKL
jgi:hypothetical protein